MIFSFKAQALLESYEEIDTVVYHTSCGPQKDVSYARAPRSLWRLLFSYSSLSLSFLFFSWRGSHEKKRQRCARAKEIRRQHGQLLGLHVDRLARRCASTAGGCETVVQPVTSRRCLVHIFLAQTEPCCLERETYRFCDFIGGRLGT